MDKIYKEFEGKTAIVTGAATGIGQAVAVELGASGVKIAVVTGKNIKGAQDTVEIIKKAGGEAFFIQCDVSNEEQVENMVQKVVQTYGKIDFAFNNAGMGPDGVRLPYSPLTQLSEENFDKIVNTNLKGTFLCLKHELLQMEKQGSGSIVNTSSTGGIRIVPGFGAYGPSKAGVIAFTKLAAQESAKLGIRVNVVCPGPTGGTELMKNTMNTNPEEKSNLEGHLIPMGRIGTTDDVTKTVLWLLSDEANYITGQVLAIDGGMTCA